MQTMGRLLMMMVMARTMPMLLLLLLMPKGTQAVSTCVAITPFFSRVTYVTCHFDRDISNLGFNVRFFPVGGGNAETALACDRLNSGRLTCTGDNSVNFDKNQANRYRLNFMRNASMNRPGSHYQCQEVPPSGGEPAERCTVVEIDIPEAEAASTTPTPKPILPGNTDDAGKNSSMDILLLILFLLFVIAIVVGCVVVFLRKERIAKWWAENYKGERDPKQNSPLNPSALRVPEGWPTFFYNMGWREALKDEEKGRDAGAAPPQSPQPKPQQSQQQPNTEASGGDPQRQPLIRSVEEQGAKQWVVSAQEPPDKDIFHDAVEPETPGAQASNTPGKKTRKELAARKKAEEQRAKAKREAEHKAKQTMQNAEKEAKKIIKKAKGKSAEDQREAERRAQEIRDVAKVTAQGMKQAAEEQTTTV